VQNQKQQIHKLNAVCGKWKMKIYGICGLQGMDVQYGIMQEFSYVIEEIGVEVNVDKTKYAYEADSRTKPVTKALCMA
jgi:hypothetical protein